MLIHNDFVSIKELNSEEGLHFFIGLDKSIINLVPSTDILFWETAFNHYKDCIAFTKCEIKNLDEIIEQTMQHFKKYPKFANSRDSLRTQIKKAFDLYYRDITGELHYSVTKSL